MQSADKIKVMVVDDSAVIRGLISRALKEDPDVEIVASAANGKVALQLLQHHPADIILLDIEMPEMDGITALPLLLAQLPSVKIVMVSTLSQRNAEISLKALSLGASDYIPKPAARNDNTAVEAFYREIREKVRALCGKDTSSASAVAPIAPLPAAPSPAASPASAVTLIAPAPLRHIPPPAPSAPVAVPLPITLAEGQIVYPEHEIKAIAIGCSTGGPQALLQVFTGLKTSVSHVPIFITQHMPPTFTTILADHVGKASGLQSAEGKDGDIAQAGHIYVAPGDFHMVAEQNGAQTVLRINQNPPVNFCRPAVDPMFESLAKIYGKHLLAVVLTGMGHDGLDGSRHIVNAGGCVIAQDEKTSVVWGMPRAVVEHKLCVAVLPVMEIAAYIKKACT